MATEQDEDEHGTSPCSPCDDGEHATIEDGFCTCCGVEVETLSEREERLRDEAEDRAFEAWREERMFERSGR